MIVGLVGKPNVGKSTFFSAATAQIAQIAPYPFTTIEANKGVAYVSVDCVDREFGVTCNPREGFCLRGKRFVPLEIMDVAGLVPEAHKGKGLGNKFMDDLRKSNLLIHIVDFSGGTDFEGNVVLPGTHNPLEDIRFLEEEVNLWFSKILERNFETIKRKPISSFSEKKNVLFQILSGLSLSLDDIDFSLRKINLGEKKLSDWSSEDLFLFAKTLREKSKPIIVAANKVDIKEGRENYEKLKNKVQTLVVPVSSEAELILKKADKQGLIEYLPGDNDFRILKPLNKEQEDALNLVKKILEKFGSTGVQEILNKAVFEVLGYKVVFPVPSPNLKDSEGRVLPDAFLLPEKATVLDLAEAIHSEIAQHFIKAVDVKTGKLVGRDHILVNRDVVEIIFGR